MTEAKDAGDPAIPVTVKKAAKRTPPSSDYAGEILQQIEREPGDRVTCVHVFDDFYRCNWWVASDASATAAGSTAARTIPWLASSTRRVRKSRFVRATFSEGRLLIEDATRVPLE
jgi:hypothetical protein